VALLGIIGGSGLYNIESLRNRSEQEIKTPFGATSDLVVTGEIGGVPVAFIARHGRNHSLLPSEVNYRANIYALKSLGVRWCVGVNAVGSLVERYGPGDVVIPDQIIDRTFGRAATFFGDGLVAHISFADPFCPVFRKLVQESALAVKGESRFSVHEGGTFICMQGPAFSTRAESHMFRSLGGSIIGMTVIPEAKLAREAEIAYATLGCVTDYDCWRQGSSVEAAEIIKVLKENAGNARAIISELATRVANSEPSALAADALKDAFITPLDKAPAVTLDRLHPIIKKYL